MIPYSSSRIRHLLMPRRAVRSNRLQRVGALLGQQLEPRWLLNAAPTAAADEFQVLEDQVLVSGEIADTTRGLIHHWRFDEESGNVAADSVGGNDGTLFGWGASERKWTAGRIGGAIDFSDSDNFVQTKTIVPSERYTIAFWSLLRERRGLNPRIISPSGAHWIIQNNEFGLGIGLYRGDSTAQLETQPVPGVWEHYAVTIDLPGQSARIYRNGIEAVSGAVKRDVPTGRWIIGHSESLDLHGDSWNGFLDELRVYNR